MVRGLGITQAVLEDFRRSFFRSCVSAAQTLLGLSVGGGIVVGVYLLVADNRPDTPNPGDSFSSYSPPVSPQFTSDTDSDTSAPEPFTPRTQPVATATQDVSNSKGVNGTLRGVAGDPATREIAVAVGKWAFDRVLNAGFGGGGSTNPNIQRVSRMDGTSYYRTMPNATPADNF